MVVTTSVLSAQDWQPTMKEKPMKKHSKTIEPDSEILDEYDFSKGVRGKYVERLKGGSNVVVLSPDVADVFSDSESVNEALRTLIKITRKSSILSE